MGRYGLRDDQWEKIDQLLPDNASDVGVTAKDDSLFVEAVLYRCSSASGMGETASIAEILT